MAEHRGREERLRIPLERHSMHGKEMHARRTLSSGSSHMMKRAACAASDPNTYARLLGGRYGLSSSSARVAALRGLNRGTSGSPVESGAVNLITQAKFSTRADPR